jgi:hypothetical protein
MAKNLLDKVYSATYVPSTGLFRGSAWVQPSTGQASGDYAAVCMYAFAEVEKLLRSGSAWTNTLKNMYRRWSTNLPPEYGQRINALTGSREFNTFPTGVGGLPPAYDVTHYGAVDRVESFLTMYEITGDSDYLTWAIAWAEKFEACFRRALGYLHHTYLRSDGSAYPISSTLADVWPRIYAWLYRKTGNYKYLEWAEEMMDNIWAKSLRNGLRPGALRLDTGAITSSDYSPWPEIFQSLMELYNTTLDKKYRDMAATLARNTFRLCRAPYGIAVFDVENMTQKNSMTNYLFNETFVYLYVTFSEEFDPVRKRMWVDSAGAVVIP